MRRTVGIALAIAALAAPAAAAAAAPGPMVLDFEDQRPGARVGIADNPDEVYANRRT
jgi:hypothetical protein